MGAEPSPAAETSQRSTRVLIVAHTTTFLTELSLFGDLVRNRAGAEVIYYCPFGHWTAEEFARKCASIGVPCLLPPLRESLEQVSLPPGGQGPATTSLRRNANRFISRVLARLAAKLPGFGMSFLAERLALVSLAEDIGGLLSVIQPRLLVLGGDMVGYDTALYIKLAHEIGVPTLIVPSTMSNGQEQAEVYHADPNYHVKGWAGHLVAVLFPKWVRTHKGRRLFRCPPGRILAMQLADLAPPQPWIFNSGAADAIAMESQAMIDYYAAAGMNHDRMVLTGSLSDDLMAERMQTVDELRRRLCRELDLDPALPIILTALPPDFLYLNGGRPECDFKDYAQLVEFWIDSFTDLKGCNRIVALHPSVDVEAMRHIERDGIRIGCWRTAEMVPACDVYVASISSTIRWAIACGKPVVNYDVYRYRYTDFQNVPGVLTMEDGQQFRSTLVRLATDHELRRSVAQVQQSVAQNWGLLDGGVGDRMLRLVEQLVGIETRPGEQRPASPQPTLNGRRAVY